MEQRLADLINLIGVDQGPICVLRRVLNKSDADPEQARMQLSYDGARDLLESDDITAGEKEFIEDPNKKLPMAAYDRRGNQYRMDFSKVARIKGKNGMYRITYSFAEFLRENGLQEGDTVVVWVLRLTAPPPTLEGVGNLAMVLLDYKTHDEAELEALHRAEWQVLQGAMAARGLLQLMVI
ncbi:hypothetical protein ABZP36_023872 [Zizania latifolia]